MLGKRKNKQPPLPCPQLEAIENKKLYWNTLYSLNDSVCDNKQNNIYGWKSTERCLQIKSSI
jgi:hypothetical protein